MIGHVAQVLGKGVSSTVFRCEIIMVSHGICMEVGSEEIGSEEIGADATLGIWLRPFSSIMTTKMYSVETGNGVS